MCWLHKYKHSTYVFYYSHFIITKLRKQALPLSLHYEVNTPLFLTFFCYQYPLGNNVVAWSVIPRNLLQHSNSNQS
jgi:hypothetical protein